MSHYVLLIGPDRPDMAPKIHDSKDIPANTTGVRLGWDPPLNTFFATVATEGANPDEDNPHIQLWLGAEPGAIATVDALQDALAAWVIIPEALRQRLAWDQAAEQMLTVGDPQAYRWFLVSGQLVADGRTIPILTGAHAADLPAGDAGRAEVAERMRRTVAADSGDPTARWQDLQVIELPIDAKQAPNLA